MQSKILFTFLFIFTFFCFNIFFGNQLKQDKKSVTKNSFAIKQVGNFSKKQTKLVSFEAIDVDYDEEFQNNCSKYSEKNSFLIFKRHSNFTFKEICLAKLNLLSNSCNFFFHVNEANPLYLSNCQIII